MCFYVVTNRIMQHVFITPPLALPFELVFFVPDVVGLIVAEKHGDACCQVAVDAVHVARCSHDGAHVFVAVLDALLHLNADKRTPHS